MINALFCTVNYFSLAYCPVLLKPVLANVQSLCKISNPKCKQTCILIKEEREHVLVLVLLRELIVLLLLFCRTVSYYTS